MRSVKRGLVLIVVAVLMFFYMIRHDISFKPGTLTFRSLFSDPVFTLFRGAGHLDHIAYQFMGIAAYMAPLLLLAIALQPQRNSRTSTWRLDYLLLLTAQLSLLGATYDLVFGKETDMSGGWLGHVVVDNIFSISNRFLTVIIILGLLYISWWWTPWGKKNLDWRRLRHTWRLSAPIGWSHWLGSVWPFKSIPEKNGGPQKSPPGRRKPLVQPDADEQPERPQPRPQPQPPTQPKVTPEPPVVPEKGTDLFRICERNKRIHSSTVPPPPDLIQPGTAVKAVETAEEFKEQGRIIERKLSEFSLKAQVVGYDVGPLVTRYELKLAAAIKISQVRSLADDLALALGSTSVRLEIPIPGKNTIGVEMPRKQLDTVYAASFWHYADFFQYEQPLQAALGVNVVGKPVFADLAQMPHLLVAGATNSGKSVFLNSLLCQWLFKNRTNSLRLLLVDLKRTELTLYEGLPHLLCPVITEVEDATTVFYWAIHEMEERYKLLEATRVRNIGEYNAQCKREQDKMPFIVIMVDELADMMMQADKRTENYIVRLSQKARAVGLHLVLATQRPSVDVVTGLIKANFPVRTAFKVSSMVDSRVVLDENGAEKLIGRGDMLYKPLDGFQLVRLHGGFIGTKDVKRMVYYWQTA